MDYSHIVAELRQELALLEDLIAAAERYAGGSGAAKRRGRPPKWLTEHRQVAVGDSAASPLPLRKRRPFSAATRKKMAEAQRERWAARKHSA